MKIGQQTLLVNRTVFKSISFEVGGTSQSHKVESTPRPLRFPAGMQD
jgi:hypothetical protein